MRRELPEGLTLDDLQASTTALNLGSFDRAIDVVRTLKQHRNFTRLLDLGCGIGGMTNYFSRQLTIPEMIGVDQDLERLEKAAQRGVKTIEADLTQDSLPLEDASCDVALSLGAFEHFVWYDNALREAARILSDDAPFVLAMPNLGSYVNRLSLLLGYQPREVEVSQEQAPGVLPLYTFTEGRRMPVGHVHTATLRCMRGLLQHFGFHVVDVIPMSPDFGSMPLRCADAVFGRFPSLSRRFIIVAQRGRRSH